MAAVSVLLCGIGLLVVGAVAEDVTVCQEACSAGGGEYEELGLLQQRSDQRGQSSAQRGQSSAQRGQNSAQRGQSSAQRGLSREGTSTSLQVMQWNVGHPTQDEPQSHTYVSSALKDGSLDFFNVINLKLQDSELPPQYSKVMKNCTPQAYPNGDLTTLVYNSDRWKLTGKPDEFCLSTGGTTGKGAAVVAHFDPIGSGPKLEVAGAHFSPFTAILGSHGHDSITLGERLQNNLTGYDAVFLGDTNGASWTKNADFAKAWHLTLGASTPTQGATIYDSTLLQRTIAALPNFFGLYWNADRIITSLSGPATPVDILNMGDTFKPLLDDGMHHPIRVSLSTSA